ncbi:ABC transporter permease [Nocardia sp. NPDC052566]|uniref:ABC transporter permease n=1 Tax=Nocardia sp. NPDC052566 TaxID=3364330 RepID=UPI0037CBBBC5
MILTLPPDLVPAVDSEVRKVTTLVSGRIVGAVLVAVALVASAVTAILAGEQDPKGQPATGTATIGLYLSVIAVLVGVGVFAAATAGAEYRYQTMPITALFTPNRDRLVAAKLSVTACFALGTALVVEVAAMVCLLAFGRGKFDFSLRLLAVLGGGLLTAICWAVIGTALGLLLRSSTLAVAALLGWLVIVEPLLWAATYGAGSPGIATILPGSATIGTVAVGSFSENRFLAPTPAALVILVLWTVALGGAAWLSVRRRDL